MQKAINVVVENFNTMRTGRANPAILDKILVRALHQELRAGCVGTCHLRAANNKTTPMTSTLPTPPTPTPTPPQVDYYGTPTPIKTLASVAVPDASTLLISPFDRAGLRDIEKALLESDIGINPSNDGEKIRLNIPPMTQVRGSVLRWDGACV